MLRKRGDGVYQVIVYLGPDPATGKERRARKTVHGFRAAQAVERELQAEGARELSARVTLGELIDRWLSVAELSPTTLAGYRGNLRRYAPPDLLGTRIDRLQPERLDRLYREMLGRGLAPSTILGLHTPIRRACAQAVKWGWLPTNPAARATPPAQRPAKISPPKLDDVTMLIREAMGTDREFGLVVWLAVVTGARRGELCGLRWSDIVGDRLTISRSVIEVGTETVVKSTKSGRERAVALDPYTIDLIAQWRAATVIRGPGFPYLFSRPDGQPWRPGAVSQRWARHAKRHVVACRFHDLRHWNVTHLLEGGTKVGLVAERVGHQSTKMTWDVYAHPVHDDEAAAAERISELARGVRRT